MFGSKGKIDIAIQKSRYAPGDIISGSVALTLKKPVKAREMSISLIGEERNTGGVGILGILGGEAEVEEPETERIYNFKQPLDSEREYSQGGEYRFEIRIPADILGVGPQMPEGKSGQVPKIAQRAAAMIGATSRGPLRWYLLAKLDIPGGRDISKKVDVTIG